jgi:hypothetical protein
VEFTEEAAESAAAADRRETVSRVFFISAVNMPWRPSQASLILYSNVI